MITSHVSYRIESENLSLIIGLAPLGFLLAFLLEELISVVENTQHLDHSEQNIVLRCLLKCLTLLFNFGIKKIEDEAENKFKS